MADFIALQARLPARYVVQDIVGSGGMGTVYLVRDRLTGSYVALKHIFNPGMTSLVEDKTWTFEFRTAITHEFRTLAALKHPNVVSVLDYGFDSEGIPYFTMEWLSKGMPLLQGCLDLPRRQQIDLFVQLLRGLSYVHRHGVVHRDLKPSNILVVPTADRGLQVKVLDFGLSISTDTEDDTTSGTFVYIAPELMRGETATAASDLYAVGVLLYELLAGQQPFAFNPLSVMEFVNQVLTLPAPFPIANVAQPLQMIVQRLLAKDPLDRYPNAREVILELNEASGDVFSLETRDTRDSFIHAAKFVGREEELAQLRAALQVAKEGKGSAWLLKGEMGVGKSRLVDELRIYALTNKVEVVVGRTQEHYRQPYGLWFRVIRTLLLAQELSPESLAVLNVFGLDLETLLQQTVPAAPEKTLQSHLHEIILQLVENYPRPLLLILEDLHWATEESLQLVKLVAEQSQNHALLMVATQRNEALPFVDAACMVMTLPALSVDAVQEMVQSMVGVTSINTDLTRHLFRQTEGNAFFLTEIMRGLAAQAGDLATISPQQWLQVPKRLEDILAQRFESISAPARALLEGASLVGREINPALLELIFEDWEIELLLQEAADFYVVEWRNGRWRFTHDQMHQLIAAQIPPATTLALHASIAEAMERYSQQDSMGRQYIPVIAWHWQEGAEGEKALPYLLLAAQDAFRVAAFDEALTYVAQALKVLDYAKLSLDTARKLMDALYLQFYAHRQREERHALAEVYRRALTLAERFGAPDLYLRAYQLGADVGALSFDPQQAQNCARQMLRYTQPGSGEAMLAHYRLSQGLRMEQRFPEASQVARQALRSLDRTAPWRGWNFPTTLYSYFALTSFFDTRSSAICGMASTLAYSYMMQGEYPSAIQALDLALYEMRQVSPSARQMIALHNCALILQGHGSVEEALRLAQELAANAPQRFPALTDTAAQLIRICEARLAGQPRVAADTLRALAETNFAEHEIEDGILCMRDALALYKQLGDGERLAYCRAVLQQYRDPWQARDH